MLLACLLASFCVPLQAAAKPDRFRYELFRHQLDHDPYDHLYVLSLRDQWTGRTLWRRHCYGFGDFEWSSDHRALAIPISDIYQPWFRPHQDLNYSIQFRLLWWRAGHRPRLAAYPGLFTDFDETADIRWSPDDRRFAFLGVSEAFDSGTLCCVDATTGHYFFGPGGVGRYRWISGDRLRYVCIDLVRDPRHPHSVYGVFVVKPPHIWSGTTNDSVWKDAEWLRGKADLHGKLWPWP